MAIINGWIIFGEDEGKVQVLGIEDCTANDEDGVSTVDNDIARESNEGDAVSEFNLSFIFS